MSMDPEKRNNTAFASTGKHKIKQGHQTIFNCFQPLLIATKIHLTPSSQEQVHAGWALTSYYIMYDRYSFNSVMGKHYVIFTSILQSICFWWNCIFTISKTIHQMQNSSHFLTHSVDIEKWHYLVHLASRNNIPTVFFSAKEKLTWTRVWWVREWRSFSWKSYTTVH